MSSSGIRGTITRLLDANEAMRRELEAALADLDGDVVHVPRQGSWTFPMLGQVWDEARHLPGVRCLFEVTAARAGETVTFSELLAHSGLPEKQQGNEHARLSRLTRDLLGEKRWPIENWQQGSPGPNGRAEMLYRMSPEIAAWFRRLEADRPVA